MNIVTLTARIATDIDVSVVNDTTLAKFRVAVPRRGKKDEADFFAVVVWGKQAEAVAKFMTVGRKVAINGRLSQNSWDAADGSGKRERVEIVASEVEFLDHAPKQAEPAPAAEAAPAPAEPVAEPATPTVPSVDAAANIWNPGAAGAFQLFTPPATA